MEKQGTIYEKIKECAFFLQELDKIGYLNMSKLKKIDNLPNNPPFKNFIKISIIHNQTSYIIDDMCRFFYNWIINDKSIIIMLNFDDRRGIEPKEKYMNIITNFLLKDIPDNLFITNL
jgi:hypothetical protein